MVQNYSTVTDFVDTIKFNPKNSIDNNVESILLKFELDIRTSKLTKTSHYNSMLYFDYFFLKNERSIPAWFT